MSSNTKSFQPIGVVLVVLVVLVGLGAILLIGQLIGFDLMFADVSWPMYIIVPGIILLATAGFQESFSKALGPFGMIVTLTGCVLAYQNWADHFQSWAYAWIIVGPLALGAGLAFHGSMHGDDAAMRQGRRMAAISIPLFLGAAAIFELIFNISGYGLSFDLPWGILLPALLIILGGVLLLRKPKEN